MYAKIKKKYDHVSTYIGLSVGSIKSIRLQLFHTHHTNDTQQGFFTMYHYPCLRSQPRAACRRHTSLLAQDAFAAISRRLTITVWIKNTPWIYFFCFIFLGSKGFDGSRRMGVWQCVRRAQRRRLRADARGLGATSRESTDLILVMNYFENGNALGNAPLCYY